MEVSSVALTTAVSILVFVGSFVAVVYFGTRNRKKNPNPPAERRSVPVTHRRGEPGRQTHRR